MAPTARVRRMKCTDGMGLSDGENRNNTMHVQSQTAIDYRRRVCLAMDFISWNLDKNLSLEKIAESASFSMFHFHRIFKAVAGETISEFTKRLRLEMAANRLIFSRDDITAIAFDCGFSSSQNFAKAFRQYFDMTPTEYRRSKIDSAIGKGRSVLSLRAHYDPDAVGMNASKKAARKDMGVEIKAMPEYRVAYARTLGAYGKESSEQAFAELMQWAGPRGYLESGIVFGLYWDNPEVTPPHKCRTDACISIPAATVTEGRIGTQVISGGPYAVCHFEIGEDGFLQAWEDAFAWLVESGYECDDKPCYELYHNSGDQHPEKKWIFDICIPLKRK